MLATYYKYTPAQIADMTPLQQIALLDIEGKQGDYIRMENMEEYLKYYGNR